MIFFWFENSRLRQPAHRQRPGGDQLWRPQHSSDLSIAATWVRYLSPALRTKRIYLCCWITEKGFTSCAKGLISFLVIFHLNSSNAMLFVQVHFPVTVQWYVSDCKQDPGLSVRHIEYYMWVVCKVPTHLQFSLDLGEQQPNGNLWQPAATCGDLWEPSGDLGTSSFG